MKKIYSILSVFAIPAFLLLYSYTGGSPGGKSGSPGDNGVTCTQCHSGTAQTQGGLITTNIPFTGYEPGQTYTITVSTNMAGISKYGFELTAEDMSGNKKGTFIITDAGRTKTANGGTAVTHTSGGTSAIGSSISWSADWTAPDSGSGQITFYTAVNATNSNGSTSGDQVYTSTRMVSENVLNPHITFVNPDVIAQDFTGDISIFGEDTDWTSGANNVYFTLNSDSTISFNATMWVILSDTELKAGMPSLINQQVGVYDVHVDDLTLENGLTLTIVDAVSNNWLNETVSVYPNPATDHFTIKGAEATDIKITDMSGKVFITKGNMKNSEEIDISGLHAGLYMILITKEDKATIKKIVIQ